MIDRRKAALVLVVLGAGLAVTGSFRETYGTVFRGDGQDQSVTTTLWVVASDSPDRTMRDAYYAAGWPLAIAAGLMVVAAVLMVRNGRTASIGRPLAMGAAGVLAGVVAFYVAQVQHEVEIMSSWPPDIGLHAELHLYSGMYLLVIGAIVGLVGAALAQRTPQPAAVEEDEEAVVVHQFDSDDDTPPFGIAIPSEERQETR